MAKTICRSLFLTVLIVVLLVAPAWAQKGKPITLTARVVDAICLLPSGLKGDPHRQCAIGCDKAGVRMYLLDEKTNAMYAVMADAPFKDPNAPLREHLEQVVSVKGDLFTGPGGLKIVSLKEVKTAAAAAQPCAPKQPCAAKAKQPCAPKQPCAAKAKQPCAPKQPCAAKNPCATKK
jgi:hypothetical protein